MKFSSPLLIITVIATTITTVEGKKRKKKSKSESASSTTAGNTEESNSSPASSSGKSTKGSKSSKSISFQSCSVANPPYEQAKVITGNGGLSVDDFLEDELLGKGGDGYLAWHSTAVYTNFVGLVEDWVNDPSDNTKTSITEAGQAAGTDHKDLSISASNQCVMMNALVRQMKDSCFYNYGGEEVYVEVASTYMTGFNLEANADEKKEDFVAYCDLGSMWD